MYSKKKQKLYKCFVSDPSEQNKSKYKSYRNKLKVLLNKAETTYYKEQEVKVIWQKAPHGGPFPG